MTPEEQAVIAAAIEWNKPSARWCGQEEQALEATVSALLAAREKAEPALEPLLWHLRTWRDVRPGDTVRPPAKAGTHMTVQWCGVQNWHVDPRSSEYSPVGLEHDIVRVLFAGQTGHRDMNPDAPVEIQLDQVEIDAAELMGWAGRIRTIA